MFPPLPHAPTLAHEIRLQAVFDRLARREFTRQCVSLPATVGAGTRPATSTATATPSVDAAPQRSLHRTSTVVPTEADARVDVDDLALLDDRARERFEFMYASQREELAVFFADGW